MRDRFPFGIDADGRTAVVETPEAIAGLIEQVLFTTPGERVNRPDFGTGLLTLVFAPNSAELSAAVQHSVQGALQRWLGDRIEVDAVNARQDDSRLLVTVRYRVRRTGEARVAELERPL